MGDEAAGADGVVEAHPLLVVGVVAAPQEVLGALEVKMGKEIITQVQETQRVPNRINPRRNTPRHIVIK